MDYSVLEQSTLFQRIPANELKTDLEHAAYQIQYYEKEETIFRLMDPADRTGIILKGRVQAQKTFPNGSQINVSIRKPGEMIGPAAAFSVNRRYPCDMIALEPTTILMFQRESLLQLMQKDIRILKNFTMEISTATYMLQQRLELLSYHGIAQKAAFYLLTQARQTGKHVIRIPDSMSKWAMIMNVSRPSLYRELRKLEDAEIISCRFPTITILQADSLQDMLSK